MRLIFLVLLVWNGIAFADYTDATLTGLVSFESRNSPYRRAPDVIEFRARANYDSHLYARISRGSKPAVLRVCIGTKRGPIDTSVLCKALSADSFFGRLTFRVQGAGLYLFLDGEPKLSYFGIETNRPGVPASGKMHFVTEGGSDLDYVKNFTVSTSSDVIPVSLAKPALLFPADKILEATPSYEWKAAQGATSYQLWVNDSVGNLIQHWYTAEAAGCAAGGICSVWPTSAVRGGGGIWWLRSFGPKGYGEWSEGKGFGIDAPTVPHPSFPLASTNLRMRTHAFLKLKWSSVPGATWYYVWVKESSGKVLTEWTPSWLACFRASGSCEIFTSNLIRNGATTWWVQAYNGAGYGPWSSGISFVH